MNQNELADLFRHLCETGSETEIIEFKEVKRSYDFDKIGKYFSALSNEANLHKKPCAWLVFGVEDKHGIVVGSQYRREASDLHKLKKEVADKTTGRLTFTGIYELMLPEGRVVLFQIPAAPAGIPVAWEGHYFGRDGESLSPLNIAEMERIRAQSTRYDWSSEICPGATIQDLDTRALEKARRQYRLKNPRLIPEIDAWDDVAFLNKAKVAVNGKLTRTAILLLGKPEAAHHIHPAVAQITWMLNDLFGNRKDYEHFFCPFILAIDAVYQKIRNPRYRYIKQDDTLFPEEVDTYEPYTIREALNNAIAHQDYSLAGRINVVESEEGYLAFGNLGSFLPGTLEEVLLQDMPQERYRNSFLVQAMVNLNMIDTVGSGILKMFEYQKKRFFPLPDFEIEKARIRLKITGRILDMEFGRILARNPDLRLTEIMMLDKLQKGRKLRDEEARHLKSKNLIEGKRPNYIFSTQIARVDDGLKAQYIRQKGFDDEHYKKMIVEYVSRFGTANRKEIDGLLLGKLPDILSERQRKTKIDNLLRALRQEKRLFNAGSDRKPQWCLVG